MSSENSGDAEDIETGDSKSSGLFVEVSAKPSEAHPSKIVGLSEDGATTRRAAKSSQVGGFTERLIQLNIQQSLPALDKLEDDYFHQDGGDEFYCSDHKHFSLEIKGPAKSLPDKSIMKKSRFGPPIIRTSGEELLPLASFWNEQDKFEPARRWQETVAHITVTSPRKNSPPIRRVHFQTGATESAQEASAGEEG